MINDFINLRIENFARMTMALFSSFSSLTNVRVCGKSSAKAISNSLFYFITCFCLITSMSSIAVAQECDVNKVTNGNFTNGLAGWQNPNNDWAVTTGSSNYARSNGNTAKKLSQNINITVGPDGVEIRFVFMGGTGTNGGKLAVLFGGTTFLYFDNNTGITGSPITITPSNGASVNIYDTDLAGKVGDAFDVELKIPLSILGVQNGATINRELMFWHYGNSGASAYSYITNIFVTSACNLGNTPLTTTQPKFNCSPGVSYLFQSPPTEMPRERNLKTEVYRLNLQDGGYTLAHGQLINTANFNSANNFGYNPYDQYIWGHRKYRNQLIRVGSDWSVEYVTIPGLPSRNYNSGDIGPEGIMYLFSAYDEMTTPVIERVDLKTLTRLTPIALPAVTMARKLIDLGFNPVDGNLYAVDVKHNLLRISLQPATLGNTTTVGATGISGTNTFGAVFFDNDGTMFLSENTSAVGANDGGRVFKILNVASDNASASFVTQGPQTYFNDGARCYLSPVESYTIKGNVWNDANGDAIKSGSEVFLNTGTENENGLWANLVDDIGNVVSSEPVNLDGSYSLYAPINGNYSIILTTGIQVPGNSLTSSSLPAGWIHTGTNNLGVANATNTTGILNDVVVNNANLTDLNFGIERVPESFNQSYLISTPTVGQSIVLNGTGQPNSPGPLTGSDPEDYANPGGSLGGKTVNITSPPSNGTLFYDGVEIPATTTANTPFVINNYDPSKLTVVLTGSGYSEVIVTYAYVDFAGKVDPTPATYKIEWTGSLPVRLVSFSVTKEGKVVLLSWATTEESNSQAFEIQHSLNGKEWKVIGRVLSAGESKITIPYSYTHSTPVTGSNYYRLRMIDNDESYAFSSIKQQSVDGAGVVAVSYPNPAADRIYVNETLNVKSVEIVNMLGASVYHKTSVSKEGINVKGLASGTYILKLTQEDGNQISEKILITK
jgi:hypothetical protein